MKEKSAKIIRVITVPPILVAVLITILAFEKHDIFKYNWVIAYCIFFLAIIPVLAYPLQKIIPAFKDKKREGQRKLAFILNFAGYGIGALISYILQLGQQIYFIFDTYFISVILLIVFNKLLKLRASGHACSATGPLLFLIYFMGSIYIIPCVIAALLIGWASIYLKRHTLRDFVTGMIICVVAFFLSFLLTFVI